MAVVGCNFNSVINICSLEDFLYLTKLKDLSNWIFIHTNLLQEAHTTTSSKVFYIITGSLNLCFQMWTTTQNNNSSNGTDFVSSPNNGKYFLIVITSTNLIASFLCILYIALKLTMNKFIKAIFCLMAMQNIIGATLITIANVIIIWTDSKSFLTCNLLTQPLLIFTRSNSVMPFLISVIRYAMAWKASYAKFLKEKYLNYTIIFGGVFPYINLMINLYLNNGFGRLAAMCLDSSSIGFSYLQLIFNIPIHALCLCGGIFFDLKMLAFVKKRNKIQPIAIIPWKSRDTRDSEDDVEVPMKATITSTSFFLSSLVLYYLTNLSNDFWITLCLVSAYYITPLPVLLIFTIKQKNNEKKTVQPPQTLQFHNEDLSVDMSDEDFDFQKCRETSINYSNVHPDCGETSIVCLEVPFKHNDIASISCDENLVKDASNSKQEIEYPTQRNVIVH